MWRFGIYADRDSVFVGGKPGRWIGFHVDLPWSECCRDYGAPYALYLHWWPEHCKRFSLPIPDRREDQFSPGSGQRVHIIRKCAVCGTEGDDVHMVYKFHSSIRNPNGIEKELGMAFVSLCTHCAALANMNKLKMNLVERS